MNSEGINLPCKLHLSAFDFVMGTGVVKIEYHWPDIFFLKRFYFVNKKIRRINISADNHPVLFQKSFLVDLQGLSTQEFNFRYFM